MANSTCVGYNPVLFSVPALELEFAKTLRYFSSATPPFGWFAFCLMCTCVSGLQPGLSKPGAIHILDLGEFRESRLSEITMKIIFDLSICDPSSS